MSTCSVTVPAFDGLPSGLGASTMLWTQGALLESVEQKGSSPTVWPVFP